MVSLNELLLSRALAEYARQRERSGELYRELADLSETVVAPRRVVRVTVGAQGRVTDLNFPSTAFKNMTGPELSALILKTVKQAQSRLDARSVALLGPILPIGASVEDLMNGTIDLEALLPAEPRLAEDSGAFNADGMGEN